MGKIIITDDVIDSVLKGTHTINEALANKYEGEIQDRKTKEICKNMTPLQMAFVDAEIGKNTTIRDVVNQGTITTAGAGHWLLPAFIDNTLHETVDRQDIMQYICNTVVSTPSRSVESVFLDLEETENKKNSKLARITEGADMPKAKLKIGEQSIRLQKYGRAVEQTYEAMLEMTVDMMAKTIEVIGKRIVKDQVNEATNVAFNGDGNNNKAGKLGDTASVNIITQDELLDFLVDFWIQTGMEATTIVAGPAMYKQLNKMVYNTNTAFGANARFTLDAPQISSNNLKLVLADELPKDSAKDIIMLLNNNTALTKYTLSGSKITEYDNNILNQTRLGTISEYVGFGKTFPNAVKYIGVRNA